MTSFKYFNKSILFIFLALFLINPLVKSADIVFDVEDTSQTFMGFGAQMWTGDDRPIAIAEDMNFRYMRINVNYDSLSFSTGTRSDYDNFWANSTYWHRSNLQSTWADLDALGIKKVMVQFGIQDVWLNSSDEFQSQYVDEHAKYWGAYVSWISSYGMTPEYIELFNEPDGTWNGYVSPSIYNEVVKAVRTELDYRGFPDVKIIGPGKAHINIGSEDDWIDALDTQGVQAMGGWSIHGWYWWSQEQRDSIRNSWYGFGNSINNKDPQGNKPVFITEYSSNATEFHGVTANLETVPWAVRVFENTLSFLNLGVNIPIYWQSADMSWGEPNNNGLVRVDGSKRPVYYALQSFFPKVPVDSNVISPTLQDNDVYSCALLKDDVLVIAMANGSAANCSKTVKICNVNDLNITEALAFVGTPGNEIVEKYLTVNSDYTIDVDLPSDTTLTIVANIGQLPQCQPVKKVLYWKLDSNVLDTSGNDNHAAASGVLNYTNGKFGKCLYFNGTNNPVIEITNAVDIPTNYDASWSMNLWVKPEVDMFSGGTYHGLGLAGFGIGDWSDNQGRERIIGNWGWSGGISFYSIGMETHNTTTAYSQNQWQMITMTYDHQLWYNNPGDNTGDSLKIYKNGVLIGSLNPQGMYYTGGFRTAAPIVRLVPETSHISPNNFKGMLDDFTIWDGVLSQSQINKLMKLNGNINQDSRVDFEDVKMLFDDWGKNNCTSSADISFDCDVNFEDFTVLAENWLEQEN
jgi:hypothetical protein